MDERHEHLVVYDYGMGGLWGFVLARNEAAVLAKYPELTVVREVPAWMTPADLEYYRQREMHDVDDPPSGVLAVIVADRRKRVPRRSP